MTHLAPQRTLICLRRLAEEEEEKEAEEEEEEVATNLVGPPRHSHSAACDRARARARAKDARNCRLGFS
jgi:hypothetical protein